MKNAAFAHARGGFFMGVYGRLSPENQPSGSRFLTFQQSLINPYLPRFFANP